ncbi:hypothetical protein CH373_17045 [Leptospira perolatii]|uniref:Uncharacterized protein n=1 Tax=Leptospira perolatii TaxID=2023191 RepID=A0A2M9ZIQ3_9LEPT|nr:hypothetical protein [Leptospira perolatii]PJZ68160.1 hypothetical protein CH360_17615 [Leptospira perolatii]PJZ71938.1 hypothetical protein CH373_17045 [Leptospira perolatii]
MNWQKIKEGFRKVWDPISARWAALYGKIFQIATLPVSSPEGKRILFLTYSWILVSLFITGFVLAGKSPFKLLIPFSLYDLPNSDPRKEVTLYGSDGEGSVSPIRRKVLLTGDDFRHDALSLIGEVGESSYFDHTVGQSSNQFKSLKKLPNLQFSVIALWKRGNVLIIDLRKSSLEDILSEMKFRIDYTYASQMTEEAKSSEINRRKLALLSSAFLAAEKTLFENFPDLQTIEYRLSGQLDQISGLSYSLNEKHVR